MAGFGKLLRQLRTSRGLQQADLAAKAGVTVFTISRGERSAACPWKRTTATDILIALGRVAPLTPEESKAYLAAAGLTALARAGSEAAAQVRPGIDAASKLVATQRELQAEPNSQTAHAWIDELLSEAGAVKVLSALEGLAAAWSVDLSPRLRADDLEKRGSWAFVHPVEHTPDGYQIRRIDPVTPAAPAPPKTGLRKAQ